MLPKRGRRSKCGRLPAVVPKQKSKHHAQTGRHPACADEKTPQVSGQLALRWASRAAEPRHRRRVKRGVFHTPHRPRCLYATQTRPAAPCLHSGRSDSPAGTDRPAGVRAAGGRIGPRRGGTGSAADHLVGTSAACAAAHSATSGNRIAFRMFSRLFSFSSAPASTRPWRGRCGCTRLRCRGSGTAGRSRLSATPRSGSAIRRSVSRRPCRPAGRCGRP